MNSSRRAKVNRPLCLGAVLPAVLLMPSTAQANIGVPSLFGLGAPFFLSLRTVGLVFAAIVAIEATALRLGLKISWRESFRVVLIANLVSSLAGLLIAGSTVFVLFLCVLPVFLIGYFVRRTDWPRYAAICAGLSPTLAVVLWAFLSFSSGVEVWALYVSLLPAFLLSVIIEYAVLVRLLGPEKAFPWVLAGNVLTYAMLAGCMAVLSFKPIDNLALTPDFLYTAAEWHAQSDEPEKALEMFEILRSRESSWDRNGNYESLYIKQELDTAMVLEERGHRREARILLEQVKNTKRRPDLWEAEIGESILALGRRLSEPPSDAPRGAAP